MLKSAEQIGRENTRLINFLNNKYNKILDFLFIVKYLLFFGAFFFFAYTVQNTPLSTVFTTSGIMIFSSLIVHLVKEYLIDYITQN